MTNLETEIWFPPFLSGKGAPRLFQGLDKPALQDIFSHSVVREYEGEKLLVQQGDDVMCVFVLLKGHLRTFRTGKDGDEVTLRMLKAGNSCMAVTVFMCGT
jgi:CRP-like cAMP-binding protein